MGSVDIRYDVTRTRLRALGSARVHSARWTGRPTSVGDLPLRFDRLGTRLCGIGPFDVRYAEEGGRPAALGAWPVRYDGDRLASIGPFGARFEDGVLREIGPLLLRYDGEHHPVRVVCTDGGPGMDPGLTAVLFLVIHRREYRTDLWE